MVPAPSVESPLPDWSQESEQAIKKPALTDTSLSTLFSPELQVLRLGSS